MERMQILSAINRLHDEHCTGCEKRVGLLSNGATTGRSGVCYTCPIGIEIREIGSHLSFADDSRKFSKAESFYVINHIDALGLEKGVKKVAKALGVDPQRVEAHYIRSKQNKARHKAV